MKDLHFDYCMEINYSEDISRCCYTIKCIPQDDERQKISNLSIEMIPESKPEWANDSHGNRYIFGCNEMPHSYFKFRITGDARICDCGYECCSTENEEMIFRHSHGLTVPGEKIKSYYKTVIGKIDGFSELGSYDKALALMEHLHNDFLYEKNCTDVKTGAEEALTKGKGVCQDYAHILTSLLILAGCSARYVTGLIIGEGESHAWVEVASEGKWYGVDPTNKKAVGDEYVKIGVGRDAAECQINRGIMHGSGKQTQDIHVSVSELTPGQRLIMKGTLPL